MNYPQDKHHKNLWTQEIQAGLDRMREDPKDRQQDMNMPLSSTDSKHPSLQ